MELGLPVRPPRAMQKNNDGEENSTKGNTKNRERGVGVLRFPLKLSVSKGEGGKGRE